MRSEIAPLVSNDISLVRLPIDVDMNTSCVSAEPYWRSAQGVPHPKVAEMGSWWYLGPGWGPKENLLLRLLFNWLLLDLRFVDTFGTLSYL